MCLECTLAPLTARLSPIDVWQQYETGNIKIMMPKYSKIVYGNSGLQRKNFSLV